MKEESMKKRNRPRGMKAMVMSAVAAVFITAFPVIPAAEEISEAAVPGQGTGTTYYVSSQNGDDANDGQSENKAFQSLEKINELTLGPGDQVLLECGSIFNNQALHLKGSGSEEAYIVVTSYGEGNKPQINTNGWGQWKQNYRNDKAVGDMPAGGKTVSTALLLNDVEYIEVSSLEITNDRDRDGGYNDGKAYNAEDALDRTGVASMAKNNGTLDHIVLRDLYIHDVDGNVYNKQSVNGGIYFVAGIADNEEATGIARYNDVLIENCYLDNVNRKGIGCAYTAYGEQQFGSKTYLSDEDMQKYGATNVVIQNNYVKGAGGDAITPQYCYRPIVQYNVAEEAGRQMNTEDYQREAGRVAAGIWPWTCKDAVFQYNECFNTLNAASGNGDGQAWDADTGDGTLYQYNYSHGNTGGTVMFCLQKAVNSTFRYNISQNDGSGENIGTLSLAKNPDAHIYNNTFYIPEGTAIIGARMGYAQASALMQNNIFYYTGDSPKTETFKGNASGDNIKLYDNNLYYNYTSAPQVDQTPILVRSGEQVMADPGTAPKQAADDHKVYRHDNAAEGEATAFDGYKLAEGSPAINAGKVITDQNGKEVEHDFFGNEIIDNPDIGAVEYPTISEDTSIHDTVYIVKDDGIYVPYTDNNPLTVSEFKSNVSIGNKAVGEVIKADGEKAADTDKITDEMKFKVTAQSSAVKEIPIIQKNTYNWVSDFVLRQQGNVWFAQSKASGENEWKNVAAANFDTTYVTWKPDKWHGIGIDISQEEFNNTGVTDETHGLIAAPASTASPTFLTAMAFRVPKSGTIEFTVKSQDGSGNTEPYIRQADNTGDITLSLFVNDQEILSSTLSESFKTAEEWAKIDPLAVKQGDYVRVVLNGGNGEKRSVHITPNIEYLDIDTEAPEKVTASVAEGTVTDTEATVSWEAAADNVGVTGYNVYLNGTKLNEEAVTGTSYRLEGLEAETEYTVKVKAVDAAGNESEGAEVKFTTEAKAEPQPEPEPEPEPQPQPDMEEDKDNGSGTPANKQEKAIETGDDINMSVPVTGILLSIGAVMAVCFRKKKKS